MNEACNVQGCRVGLAIVDDEKDLVKMFQMAFERRGILICFIAYDGEEAIKKFIECTPKPHVVLMDYRLPLMNGIEATKEILKIDPATKIVMLSADSNVKEKAIQAGAHTFLSKPASIDNIINAIENAFGKKS